VYALALVVLGALVCAPPARAQDAGATRAHATSTPVEASAELPPTQDGASASDLARARVLFQRGVELANHQDYTGAAKRFREALAIHHAPAITYNLASALYETEAHAEAYELVQTVLHDGTTPEPLRVRARRLEESLERSVARLTVIVSSEQSNVSIQVDGKPLAPALVGVTRAVAPGDHVVLAERSGVRISERNVRIAAGTAALVDVSLVMTPREAALAADTANQGSQGTSSLPVLSAADASSRDDDAAHDKRRRRIWLIGGASVVAVGAGVVLALLLTRPDPRTQAPIAGDGTPGVLVWK
jgi:hypothetical protein